MILTHHRGLAASPRLSYTLSMEGKHPFHFLLLRTVSAATCVCCGRLHQVGNAMGLGFDIHIWYSREIVEQDELSRALLDFDSRMALDRISIARWSSYNYRYFEQLVTVGRAELLRDQGYPTLFSVAADAVLPYLNEPGITTFEPRMKLSTGFAGHLMMALGSEAIATCPPDATLYAEVWDQS